MCQNAESEDAHAVPLAVASPCVGEKSAPAWLANMAARRPVEMKSNPLRTRKKLWELPRSLHCSVIGTCLSTLELRKTLSGFSTQELKKLSDLALHEEGVIAAGTPDQAGKALHKALERRHEATLRNFERAKDAGELVRLWDEAKQGGDIPGAYWAILTHRLTTDELAHGAFGDVHMLSHLVGSANRAALGRLASLEEHRAELEQKIERQQARLNEIVIERQSLTGRLDALLIESVARNQSEGEADVMKETLELRQLVASLQERLSAEIGRRERADQQAAQAKGELDKVTALLDTIGESERELQAELASVESHVASLNGLAAGYESRQYGLHGAKLLYVGGRPGQVQQIRGFVEAMDAEFLHHDGGLEERKGLLAGLVSRADQVYFPVDCISHSAANALKRLCGQAGKPYLPLRSAGLTSFISALHQPEPPQDKASHAS